MKLPNFTSINNNSDVVHEKVYKKISIPTEPYSYGFYEFEDSKKLFRYINKMVSMSRQSQEYKRYIKYLKEAVELTKCNFFKNIDISEIDNVGIEFHHYPFTIFDIVETVTCKHTHHFTEAGNTFDIIDEVMQLHYDNKVGLVPLSKTVHELAHTGDVFIRLQDVFGDIECFVKEYSDYINTELMEKLDTLYYLSRKNNYSEDDNKVLRKSFQYIIHSEDQKLKPIEMVTFDNNEDIKQDLA